MKNKNHQLLYTALAEAAKGQNIKVVQHTVEYATLHYWYTSTTIISPTLGKKILVVQWHMSNKLDFSTVVQSFLMMHHTAAYSRSLASTASTHATMMGRG